MEESKLGAIHGEDAGGNKRLEGSQHFGDGISQDKVGYTP